MLEAGNLPGIAGLIIALITGYVTYRTKTQENRNVSKKDAVVGYDMLAEDLRTDLAAASADLKVTRTELLTCERAVHQLTIKVDDLERENATLTTQVERLLLENKALRAGGQE